MSAPAMFTAARIAQELDRSRQSVYVAFAQIAPDGPTTVAGQRTNAWKVENFPSGIHEPLEEIRLRKRVRSIAALLLQECSRYVNDVPLAQIAPAARDKACKVREALAPFLAQSKSKEAAGEKFAQEGVAKYRAVLGYSIGTKYWRDLLDRTVELDRGYEEWQRLDLYLPKNPVRVSATLPARTSSTAFALLDETIVELVKVGPLNVERKDQLWTRVCDQLKESIDEGANTKKAKRGILNLLLASGLLGGEKETLRRNLNHHWNPYCAGGEKPFIDGRVLRSKVPLADEDKVQIVGLAINKEELDPAWREVLARGTLSAEEQARYSSDTWSAPRRIRRICGPLMKSLIPVAKDQRSERADGPSHHGDYSQLFAGEIYSADDGTPEHLCHRYGSDGRPKFLQGQLIVVIDIASRRILAWSFTEGAYGAAMIRLTFNRVCEDYCLPERLNIERGLWERSKLIVGSKVIGHTEWEMGLREFMKVSHAKRPQGKAHIEKFYDQLWKRMRTLPGWCGKDMRTTMSRDLARKVALAKSGKLDAATFSLTKEQMVAAMAEAIDSYNATPQPHSEVLRGMSPNEAWTAKQSPTGRPKLDEKSAYLLAYHREKRAVRKCQIEKTHRKVPYFYHSPDLVRFDRQDVLFWWNPEDLTLAGFSSLDRKQGPFPLTVQQKTPVTAEIDSSALGEAQSAIDETLEARRVIYRSCQPWMVQTKLRPTLTDQPTANFGSRLGEGIAETKTKQTARHRQVSNAQRLVREGGLKINVDHRNATRSEAAAELVREALGESTEGDS